MILLQLVSVFKSFSFYSELFIAIMSLCSQPEAEIVRQRVSIADRKVFARPESFCVLNAKMLINYQYMSENSPDNLESVRTIRKVSPQSGKCLDLLESVRTV